MGGRGHGSGAHGGPRSRSTPTPPPTSSRGRNSAVPSSGNAQGLRFPEGRLYEDQIVAQRMYAQARRFDVVPDVVAQWRVRADGTSITQREAQLEVLRDCLTAMDGGLRVLESSGHPRVRAGTSPADPLDGPARLAEIARTHPRTSTGARSARSPDRCGTAQTAPAPDGHLRGGRRRRRAPVVRRQPRPATRFTTVARMTAPNR